MVKLLSLALVGAVLACSSLAIADDPNVYVPETTRVRFSPFTGRPIVHTNHLIYVGPPMRPGEFIPPELLQHGPAAMMPPVPSGYSPAQIRSAYNVPSNGGSGMAIAIVDAFHYATSLNDFNVFATQYGLPTEPSATSTLNSNQVFQVKYQGGSAPGTNSGWAQEESLDIEWAHALAPNAKIYLIEANSANFSDLLACVNIAAALPNVKAISMSWGSGEFSNEAAFDSNFLIPGVVCFSSAGDVGGAQSWPAISPFVVGVGGTHLVMNGNNFQSETAWNAGGGGPSAFYGRPAFQHRLYMTIGGRRGSPDLASDADPSTGCAVYDSTPNNSMSGWLVFGGTSLSSPTVAGMYVTSGAPGLNSYMELVRIYNAFGLWGSASFRDITSGSAGGFSARPGWDFVTGVGAPVGIGGF